MANQEAHPNDTTVQAGARLYTHILVALDGSEFAERILPYVEELAEKFGSTLTLVQATVSATSLVSTTAPGAAPAAGPLVGPAPVGTTPANPMEIVEAQRREASNYLSQLAERFRGRNFAVNYEHQEGPAAEVILERARELGVDLIAMTTHGRSGLGRLVLGSVADEVMRHALCPVLLVRIRE